MNENDILIYQTEDGTTKVEVKLEDDTVWLNQSQMVELFQSSKPNISEHIKHIFVEGELEENSVVRKFRTTASDGKKYNVDYYNLDVIISVGYRVKSHQGTQFRIWATERLREYIIKGFTMNDELLKVAGGGRYWDELLERIRDIRSSEKIFWRKVLDIYATSIDYDKDNEMTRKFFQTVQNKMHYACHGYTASELIFYRVDANKPNIGMTSFKGDKPTLQEAKTAKNYLSEEELTQLNLLVSSYLDFAESQIRSRIQMRMIDWIKKLDDFIKLFDRNILTTAGKITHKLVEQKAKKEFNSYKEFHKKEISSVEKDYFNEIEHIDKKELPNK